VLAALFLLLAGRLVQLQGFKSHTYAQMAEEQRIRHVPQPATRGEIKDRNGNVLAVDVAADDVAVRPRLIKDAYDEAKKLAPLIKQPLSVVLAKMISSTSNYNYVAYEVDPATADKITKLNLPGVALEAHERRLYPAGATAANVLGFVGRDGSGRAGLESAYNTQLAGKAGSLSVEEDPLGRLIPSGTHREKEPVPGQGLKLTLDRDIQFAAEAALADQVRASGALKGVAIVMDPHTGDIYAMASSPGFNPNNALSVPEYALSNPAVAWTFEPGSVNKLVTVAAAVNEGIAIPTTEVDVPASVAGSQGIRVDDKIITDAEIHPPEMMTVAGVLAKSCIQGTLLLSRRLPSRGDLEKWLRAFGLGEKTNVGLPGESPGLLLPASQWSNTMAATIPYGQSMSVNALQVASAYATIANGGVRVTPRIIDGTIDGDGKVTESPVGPTHRVVSKQTAKTVTDLLEQVTSSSAGTGTAAAIPGYRVAGKTGTADRYDPKLGKYSGYVASFVGFAPADKPSLVVLVSLDNPVRGYFGGTSAAPVFQKIMGFALTSLRIPPTGTKPVVYPLSVP
jgi:cell division protein FtsI (penicillin-binding protein 3)